MAAKRALVLGAGGFIGSHMVKRLKGEGYWVRGIDIKLPEFSETQADEFYQEDIRYYPEAFKIKGGFDEVLQFAADMGGAGFIFSGENDADIFNNSMGVNLAVAENCVMYGVKKIFFASSACIYPQDIQDLTNMRVGALREADAYPANPDSIYGWEKLGAERMYDAYHRNYGLNIRIGRFHNIFGPEGTYTGGREKAPAAICRKVAEAVDSDSIEVWGDGEQTRSFLYIDECIEGVRRLMASDYTEPLNIGSDEMVSINKLAEIAIEISGKKLKIKHNKNVTTLGVRGRNSDNRLIEKVLGWKPRYHLSLGLGRTYDWIEKRVQAKHSKINDYIKQQTHGQENY